MTAQDVLPAVPGGRERFRLRRSAKRPASDGAPEVTSAPRLGSVRPSAASYAGVEVAPLRTEAATPPSSTSDRPATPGDRAPSHDLEEQLAAERGRATQLTEVLQAERRSSADLRVALQEATEGRRADQAEVRGLEAELARLRASSASADTAAAEALDTARRQSEEWRAQASAAATSSVVLQDELRSARRVNEELLVEREQTAARHAEELRGRSDDLQAALDRAAESESALQRTARERDEAVARLALLERQVALLAAASPEPDAAPTAPVVGDLPVPVTDSGAPATRPSLYAWQQEALDAWDAAGSRGVVQAVTGAGKTRVGVWAAARRLEAGGKVLVLVPTVELQRQWVAVLREALPDARTGLLGDGHRDDLRSHDVVVATPLSAANHRPLMAPGASGLLVADECHRYGADSWAVALDPAFGERLGLTATYARPDDGCRTHLDPYFGGIVFDLWYDRALADGVIAPFRVALVAVDFSPQDAAAYQEHDEAARQARAEVYSFSDAPDGPFGEFMKHVTRLSEGGHAGDPRATKAARRYLSAFNKRREVLANASCKIPVLRSLAPAARTAGGTLVFTQTREGAERAAAVFAAEGCVAASVYSGLDDDERRLRMQEFRDGSVDLVTAPRLLDEGIDVPEADLAVVVSASRSQRQMVQRLGRVVRVKPDGRAGRLVVLYVRGTSEDPDAHEDSEFLARCLPHAQAVLRVHADAPPERLLAFLDGAAPAHLPEQPSVEEERVILPDDLPDAFEADAVLASDLDEAMDGVLELDVERDMWLLLAARADDTDDFSERDDEVETFDEAMTRLGLQVRGGQPLD